MKILQTDKETFRVFGESLDIKDKLPVGVYDINFSPMGGFYLTTHETLEVTEKLYGKVEQKIASIIRGYQNSERSLGVIFSGDKGIGKSLASRLLCQKMLALGYPVILVSNTNKGIIDFLTSIKQECVFLFDEFEKNYYKEKEEASDNGYLTQTDFLTFFDGTNDSIKRFFIVTCNEINELSSYLINRPGRFHYHIRWSYPSEEDITEYLQDKLNKAYWGEIEKVCKFNRRMALNYDCLRSIAFELNMGVSFEEAIENLNIIRYSTCVRAKATIEMDNGKVYEGYSNFDMFDDNQEDIYVHGDGDRGYVYFYPSKLIFNGDEILLDTETTTTDFCGKVKKGTLIITKSDGYSFVL